MELELREVISKYFKDISNCKIEEFGSGLINRTFFLQHDQGKFLLQKINHHVFKQPVELMQHIEVVSSHLISKKYPKSILTILTTLDKKSLVETKQGNFWRIFLFIENTISYNIPLSNKMVFDAAKAFGEFLFYLKDIPNEKIKDTIPDFHNTPLRFKQLNHAKEKDSSNRVNSVQGLLQKIDDYSFLIEKIDKLQSIIPSRIIHNDLKINNLLFQADKTVQAVIDWDTIMKGNILYDFGDLVRTMACTENEESVNFDKVKINPEYLEQIVKGFSESTFSFLSEIEKENLLDGAKFIIYEQAIRFLTDYLNGDTYYNITYTNQNLNRTKNQLMLLDDLMNY